MTNDQRFGMDRWSFLCPCRLCGGGVDAFHAERSIRRIGVTGSCADISASYRSPHLPMQMENYFRPPEEFFIAPDTQEPYTRGHLIPILDCGQFSIVTFPDPETKDLVQIDVESPDEERTRFHHWQQYLADIMIHVAEAVESDDRIRDIAMLIGFRYTPELFEFLGRLNRLNGEEWWEARRRFPLSIATKP